MELGQCIAQRTHNDIIVNSVLKPQGIGIEKLGEAVCVYGSAAKSRSIEVI